MVTHNIDDVFEMSQHCVIMNKGEIIQSSDINDIISNPKNEFVSRLLNL